MRTTRGRVLWGSMLLAALVAGAGTPTLGTAPARAAGPCPTRGAGLAIGSVVQLVNSSAFVGGRYVGVAPFAIRAGDTICTDARGQVVFALTGSRGSSTACITLPASRVLAVARVRFERGTSWCVVRGAPSRLTVGSTDVTAGKDSLFGISVLGTRMLVKVLIGSVDTPQGRIDRLRQSTLAPGTSPTSALPTADDRRAIAQLSGALAKPS
jgi:hypothetical protein